MGNKGDIDLTYEGDIPGENPSRKPSAPAQAGVAGPSKTVEFRGVGDIFKRKPIAAVLEILHRAPINPEDPKSKWRLIRPFTSLPTGAKRAFAIMTSVPTKQGARGQLEREPHPQFELFNTCAAENAQTIRGKIVNWSLEDAYKNYRGAYKAPEGGRHQSPAKGWWCRGDGVEAQRFDGRDFKMIKCPARMCEFAQEGTGARGQGCHCKPHLELMAQFNWPEGNPLPRVVFEFDSQSWNNVSNIEGMIELITKSLDEMGIDSKKFPFINLQFTMNLKERHQTKRKFPEVSFSIDGDHQAWMLNNGNLMQQAAVNKQLLLEQNGGEPAPLNRLPADGFTVQEMDEARHATLNPNYKPANVRSIDQ